MVKGMAAMGIQQDRIALLLGVKSPKTLRKFFRKELDRGETEATYNMEQAQYKAGMAGNVRAQTSWLNRHNRSRQSTGKAASPPPFIVYEKKEAA
jgi:hypothetical protein